MRRSRRGLGEWVGKVSERRECVCAYLDLVFMANLLYVQENEEAVLRVVHRLAFRMGMYDVAHCGYLSYIQAPRATTHSVPTSMAKLPPLTPHPPPPHQ